jgi:hypothetical protein
MQQVIDGIKQKFMRDARAAGFTEPQVEFLCTWMEDKFRDLAEKAWAGEGK